MSRTLPWLAAALCMAVALPAGSPRCLGAEPPAEKKIEEVLEDPTQMEFNQTPFQDVVEYLIDYHGIEIQLDKKALDEAGIAADTLQVTRSLKGISLRSALELMLPQYGLTYLVRDEVLLITTPKEAASRLTTKVYRVDDLIKSREGEADEESGGNRADFDSTIELITRTVEPNSWDEFGGPGSLAGATFNKVEVLVISQTYHVHRKIAALLEELREVTGAKPQAAGK